MGKIELKFWQIILCMDYKAYVMVYWDGDIFEFFAIVPEIPNPTIREIQDCDQHYHISAMKFLIFT
jgi:hypothetical protein